jgi:lipopolysaccharide export system protein LptA
MKIRDPLNLRSRNRRAERVLPCLQGLLIALVLSFAATAQAERADRDKPVTLEADRVEIDDQKKEATFLGNVTLTQGTLVIKGDRIVVKQDATGFQFGVAYGAPAYFKQKREGVDEYIEGFAQRLEYDGKAEKVEMFVSARLQRGGDEVRGDYISYNAATEFFQVVGGGKSAATPGNPHGRVRAIIQPKPRDEKPAAGGTPLPLKPSDQVPAQQ